MRNTLGCPALSGSQVWCHKPGLHLICVVREVDLVEDLGGFVLDGLHLYQVRGVLPGPISGNGTEMGGIRFAGPNFGISPSVSHTRVLQCDSCLASQCPNFLVRTKR